jgi:O-acetyl-ADP-ribose deacetylase (regulator of RNase III)
MTNILHAAVDTNITSVAVCALGSGIFGWDAKLAREVLVRATFAWERERVIRPCTALTVVFFDLSRTGTDFFCAALQTAIIDAARATARADPSRRSC